MKKERPLLAGFALGYAAMLRIFPIFAILAIILKAVAESISAKSAVHAPTSATSPIAAGLSINIKLSRATI